MRPTCVSTLTNTHTQTHTHTHKEMSTFPPIFDVRRVQAAPHCVLRFVDAVHCDGRALQCECDFDPYCLSACPLCQACARWRADRLRTMKVGDVSVVATYLHCLNEDGEGEEGEESPLLVHSLYLSTVRDRQDPQIACLHLCGDLHALHREFRLDLAAMQAQARALKEELGLFVKKFPRDEEISLSRAS